jgi:N-formylglutamate amidohydrolase
MLLLPRTVTDANREPATLRAYCATMDHVLSRKCNLITQLQAKVQAVLHPQQQQQQQQQQPTTPRSKLAHREAAQFATPC